MATYSNWTVNPQLLVPAAAAGVSVTPNGTAFVNSAYVQVTAGISGSIVVVGLVVSNNAIIADYRVDLASGAAASEVVIGTLTNRVEVSDTGLSFLEFKTPLYVPNGLRVAVRMRKSGTSTTAWFFKMVYYVYEGAIPAGVANLAVTADFSAVGTVVSSGGGAGAIGASPPVRETLYLKRRH